MGTVMAESVDEGSISPRAFVRNSDNMGESLLMPRNQSVMADQNQKVDAHKSVNTSNVMKQLGQSNMT